MIFMHQKIARSLGYSLKLDLDLHDCSKLEGIQVFPLF